MHSSHGIQSAMREHGWFRRGGLYEQSARLMRQGVTIYSTSQQLSELGHLDD